MRVLLFMAISLNGIIARPDGDEDFLSEYGWDKFLELANQAGCIIWGRGTYDVVLANYADELSKLDHLTKVVVSTSELSLAPGFLQADSPEHALQQLEAKGYHAVVLGGGSRLNASFAAAGLVDYVMINIEPVIVGEGIPLFASKPFDLNLKLLEVNRYQDDGITLEYEVMK